MIAKHDSTVCFRNAAFHAQMLYEPHQICAVATRNAERVIESSGGKGVTDNWL